MDVAWKIFNLADQSINQIIIRSSSRGCTGERERRTRPGHGYSANHDEYSRIPSRPLTGYTSQPARSKSHSFTHVLIVSKRKLVPNYKVITKLFSTPLNLLVVDVVQRRDEGRVDLATPLLVKVDDLGGSLGDALGGQLEEVVDLVGGTAHTVSLQSKELVSVAQPSSTGVSLDGQDGSTRGQDR